LLSGGSSGGGGGSGGTRRLRSGRTVSYSPTEWRTFEPAARVAEAQARLHPEHRDLFLCHAWEDRTGAAKELYEQLVASGATVWFSETEVGLGKSLLREIDRGLAMSRIGIVLATPALLQSLLAQGELSALLATDRVIPIAHGTTFDGIREVSPLLAARSGLTVGSALSMQDAATKVAAAAAAESNS
jgi:TIR domain